MPRKFASVPIFRYYYDKFEGKKEVELQKIVADSWDELMTLFRMLDDWYNTPFLYNTIGFLSQCGEDISRLVMHYENMQSDSTHEDFHKYLKERVRYFLNGVKLNERGEITTSYKERANIFRILLALNIHLLNQQNSKLNSDSEVYKFPFDVLNSQDWDIEHIDSFHTNELKKDEDKLEWIKTAESDLSDFLQNEQDKEKLEQMKASKKLNEAIEFLQVKAGETEVDDETKNGIGNLTLLDSKTNREYHNDLFCTKRRKIIGKVKEGVFVPVATQYVFLKFFDEKGTNRSKWSQDDMVSYQKFISDTLSDYLSE